VGPADPACRARDERGLALRLVMALAGASRLFREAGTRGIYEKAVA
jgi:hypothetical protein